MQNKYSDEFKKAVIEDYYTSLLGVRAIALKYDLPSKNYLDRWEKQLKAKGIIPMEATKPIKTAGRSPEAVMRKDTNTEREKQYKAEIEVLKAKVEYLESLESLQPFLKKNKVA